MNANEYLDYLKKIYKGRRINLIANDKSMDMINYSYLGRNIVYAKDSLLMLINSKRHSEIYVIIVMKMLTGYSTTITNPSLIPIKHLNFSCTSYQECIGEKCKK